jgi:hypothetical protein
MSTNSIYSIYKRTLVSNYGELYHPNWHPTSNRELGDYGILRNGIFTRIGNISKFKIPVVSSKPVVKAHQTFSSGSGVSVSFEAGGTVRAGNKSSAKAKMKVGFTGGQGISISAYGIQHTTIQNYAHVMNAILLLYRTQSNAWQEQWVVITDLYQAQKCIMAISAHGSTDAEIEFETAAKSPLNTANLTNANLGLVCKNQRNIGYTLDTQQGKVTLGVGFGKVHVPFIRKPRFQPFENRGSWGSDGPTTQLILGFPNANYAVPIPDEVEMGTPRFVRLAVSASI